MGGASRSHASEPGAGVVEPDRAPVLTAPHGTEVAIPDFGSPGESAPPPRHHVAVVDDETMVLRAISMLLQRMNCEVVAFPLPELALEHLRDPERPVDLLITDYLMPGMTGIDLAEAASAARPGLPILLASGNPEDLLRDRMARAGIREVLTKPFGSDELREALHRSLVTETGGGESEVAGPSGGNGAPAA